MLFGAVGDLVWRFGCEKESSRRCHFGMCALTCTSQAQVFCTSCNRPFKFKTKRERCPCHGAHTLGACPNHTHVGPQTAPSGKCLKILNFRCSECLFRALEGPLYPLTQGFRTTTISRFCVDSSSSKKPEFIINVQQGSLACLYQHLKQVAACMAVRFHTSFILYQLFCLL